MLFCREQSRERAQKAQIGLHAGGTHWQRSGVGIAAVVVFTIRGGKAPFKSVLTFVGPGGDAPDFAKQVRVCVFQLKNESSVSHKSQ